LLDITTQEAQVDKQLAEIQKLQENLRQSVGSTVTLTNGAKLTNDGVEENGKGIRQLSSEELKAKGIKDPEKLLGKDNAFIEFTTKVKTTGGSEQEITQQHLVNSQVGENKKRTTNITTDAQDLNNDGTIQDDELPSSANKPLEKILKGFSNGNAKEIQLSSVQFSGDQVIIPPSARGKAGQTYKSVYEETANGNFKSLQLSKNDTGMSTKAIDISEFQKFYNNSQTNLTSLITRNTPVTGTPEDTTKLKPILGSEVTQKKVNRGEPIWNPEEGKYKQLTNNQYEFTLPENKYSQLTGLMKPYNAQSDYMWLQDAYHATLNAGSEKSFGSKDIVTKTLDPQGVPTYRLQLTEETYNRFRERLEQKNL
jgi:hypothetical protein